MTRKAAVVSGGLDSVVLLHYIKKKPIDGVVKAYFMAYGQDNLEKELQAVRQASIELGIPLEVLDINLRHIMIGRVNLPMNLWDCDVADPTIHIFTSALLLFTSGVAVRDGIYHIIMAIHKTDLENFPYLKETLQMVEKTISSIAGRKFTIELPFENLSRPEVIKLALEMKVPLEKTWSCHYNRDVPCGKCGGCKERRLAFEALGIPDPLAVATPS